MMNSGRHTSAHARKHGLQTANLSGTIQHHSMWATMSLNGRQDLVCSILLKQEALPVQGSLELMVIGFRAKATTYNQRQFLMLRLIRKACQASELLLLCLVLLQHQPLFEENTTRFNIIACNELA